MVLIFCDVGRGMDAGDLVLGCITGIDEHELIEKPADLYEIAEAALRFRALVVIAWLHG